MKQLTLPTLTCLAFLLAFSCISLYAQETEVVAAPVTDDSFVPEFRLGISGGLTKNSHQDMMSILMQSMGCVSEFIEEEVEWGTSAGLVMGYKSSQRSGITAHLLYSTRPGSARISLPGARVLLVSEDPGLDPVIAEISVETQIAVKYNLLELSLMSTVDLLSIDDLGVGLAFGGSVAHVDVFTESIYQHLRTPNNARFVNYGDLPVRDSGRVLVFADDDLVEDISSTRFSLRTGAFVDIGFLQPLHITPGVYYDYGLTRLVKGFQWTVNSLLFQLDVTMEL